jgi:hypothetical protein
MRRAKRPSTAAVQGNNCRSATQSCDQGRAQAHPPPVVWIVEGLPAPKQPKQPSREILDHSRRFIPNTVRPFPSSDSSRAITQLHHTVRLALRARQAPQAQGSAKHSSRCLFPLPTPTAREKKARRTAPDCKAQRSPGTYPSSLRSLAWLRRDVTVTLPGTPKPLHKHPPATGAARAPE